MNVEQLEQLRTLVAKTAAEQGWSDDGEDFMVDDYAGGNVDDAYSGGVRDGKIGFAREIAKLLNV